MSTQSIKRLLDARPDLRGDLFVRGFLVTDDPAVAAGDAFPFYGRWRQETRGGLTFVTHELTGAHFYDDARTGRTFFVLGHCYNPFTMEVDEEAQLRRVAEAWGTPEYFGRVSELTGIFVLGSVADGRAEYLVDPAGLQSACSGVVDGHFYLTSHAQLVGDLLGLAMDPFVQELVAYKWYRRVMGCYLPADLTPFSQLKRVVNDMAWAWDGASVTHRRFWPAEPVSFAASRAAYDAVIGEASDILRDSAALVAQKWPHPWISLTGGIDSNTTFAAADASGELACYEAFSYVSADKEVPDAAAAQTIAEAFGVPYHRYEVPETSDGLPGFEEAAQVLAHNNGYVADRPANETRKRVVLKRDLAADVEVKSWVSETVRAYWFKHYGRRHFPRLSPKLYRNLYKIFLTNRLLAHKVDALFERYIAEYGYRDLPNGYEPADLHFHEVTWGSWGGLNISEMKYYADITVLYNNRRLLQALLRVPLDKRISDQHHLDMKRTLSPKLYDMGIRVVNLHETNFRAFALNVVFTLNMWLPW